MSKKLPQPILLGTIQHEVRNRNKNQYVFVTVRNTIIIIYFIHSTKLIPFDPHQRILLLLKTIF